MAQRPVTATLEALAAWINAEALKVLREIRYFLNRRRFGTFTWDPPNVASFGVTDTTLTSATYPALEGIKAGSVVTLSPPDAAIVAGAGLVAFAWAPADDSITVRLGNFLVTAYNMPSGTWGFEAVDPS